MRFAFFLANELGMTVRGMLHEMGSREFVQWAAWYNVKDEPLPKGEQSGAEMWEQVRAATMGAQSGPARGKGT
jgi:hypothetical protein